MENNEVTDNKKEEYISVAVEYLKFINRLDSNNIDDLNIAKEMLKTVQYQIKQLNKNIKKQELKLKKVE